MRLCFAPVFLVVVVVVVVVVAAAAVVALASDAAIQIHADHDP